MMLKPVTCSWLLWILAIALIFGFVATCSAQTMRAKTDGATIVLTDEPCAMPIEGFEFRAYAFAEGFPNLEGCYQDDANYLNVNIKFFDEQIQHETTRSYGKSHFEEME